MFSFNNLTSKPEEGFYLCAMAKIIIKNAPRDANQLGKLIIEIATRDREAETIPADGIVDARELAKSKKPKKAKK
jgi:hypothetical protein